jgi:hypothetical protein
MDKKWSCGHIGYYQIRVCDKLFKGCRGTKPEHEMVDDPEKCGDCQRRDAVPKPFALGT